MKGFDVQSHRYKRDNLEKLETVFSKEDSEDFGRESMLKHGHHAKDYYEMRLSELSKTVASTVAALTDDQLLSTMLEEPTSRPFAQHRVKEIIEECMENDREGLIKQLTEQFAALESDYCELEQEYSKVDKITKKEC